MKLLFMVFLLIFNANIVQARDKSCEKFSKELKDRGRTIFKGPVTLDQFDEITEFDISGYANSIYKDKPLSFFKRLMDEITPIYKKGDEIYFVSYDIGKDIYIVRKGCVISGMIWSIK